MAANVVDAIGVVGSVFGIISFFQDQFPGDPPQGATVQIKIGNPGDDDGASLGGQISGVYGWDINNNYLGQSKGGKVDDSDVGTFTIDQFTAGTRGDFIGVSADDDAACISWITVAEYDGTTGGAWTGDVGYNCGHHWYHQTESAGTLKDSMDPYIPMCSWLDGDHTGNLTDAALKFRVLAYGSGIQETLDNNKVCDATIWGPDNGPINAAPSGKRSASNKPRLPWMEEVLIVSNLSTRHTAESLCSSATSWGPDFVGIDGKFCDMATKTLSPLCSTANLDGCVNVDSGGKTVLTKRTAGPKRAVDVRHKSYARVKNWTATSKA
ncbi:hypothetical protein GE09DRAFT_1266116 [Coniochaeta sp. 2T2.1]|nr:hypothetical protein GE09DRAFT_1266116 [Coniochaeta sp. 2T2.1]